MRSGCAGSLDHILWEGEKACWEDDCDGVDLEFYDPYGVLCIEADGDPVRLRALIHSIHDPPRGDVEEQVARGRGQPSASRSRRR